VELNRGESETYDFVVANCWMDDIRSRTRDYSPWHYVNLPFTPEGLPIPDGEDGPNVVWGLELAQDVLAGRKTHPAISNKSLAVIILAHLVGDVHQPLHTTSRDNDAGGNRTKIANLRSPASDLLFGGGGNLHFFWDSAYRRVFKDGEATVSYEPPIYDRHKPVAGHIAALPLVEKAAAAIVEEFPPSVVEEQGDATSWAMESHRLGFSQGYGALPETNGDEIVLDEAYVSESSKIARQRLAMAGYRLGALLNEIYGE